MKDKRKGVMSLIVLTLGVLNILAILIFINGSVNSNKFKIYYKTSLEGHFLREIDVKEILFYMSEDILLDYWFQQAGNPYQPTIGELNYTGVNPKGYDDDVDDKCVPNEHNAEDKYDDECDDCGTLVEYTVCLHCHIIITNPDEGETEINCNFVGVGDCPDPPEGAYKVICGPKNADEIPGCDDYPIIENLTKLMINNLILTENINKCEEKLKEYCITDLKEHWAQIVYCSQNFDISPKCGVYKGIEYCQVDSEEEEGSNSLKIWNKYYDDSGGICEDLANDLCNVFYNELNNKLNNNGYPKKLIGRLGVEMNDTRVLNSTIRDYLFRTSRRIDDLVSWRMILEILNVNFTVEDNPLSNYNRVEDKLTYKIKNINITYKVDLYHILNLNLSMDGVSYLFDMEITNKPREAIIKIIPKGGTYTDGKTRTFNISN